MVAYAQLMNVSITLDTTERILNEVTQEQSRASIDPQRILSEVAGYYGLAVEDLMTRTAGGRFRCRARWRCIC